MKIECKNKREGGSVIDIGGTDYHFKPQADGAHVADVAYEEHVERFLSIPEAYCIYRPGNPVKIVEGPSQGAQAEGPAADEAVESTETPEIVADGDDDLEALKAAFKEKFGHAPHYKWSIETIKTKLAE